MFVFMIKRSLFYCKLIVMSLFRAPKDRIAPLTIRRIIVLLLLNTAGLLAFFTNWICLLFDEIFYPGFKKVEIKDPYFILGVPRSGSTLFLRLLSCDEKHFTSFKLWEIIFAPSVIQRNIYGFLGKLDQKVGGVLSLRLKSMDKWLFTSSRQIHQVGFYLMEEDGILFIWIFSTVFLFFAYPFIDQFDAYLHFDDKISEKDKRCMMRYYSKCVQRHLFYHGAHKKLLSKNPTFAPMVRTLAQYFPDARFLNTVRTPYEQIPSIFSFLVYFISMFGGDFRKAPNYKDFVFEVIKVFYLNPMNSLRKLNEEQYAFVMFDDLVKDPSSTIRDLYEKFGLELSEDFEMLLAEKTAAAKKYKSEHNYTLEQFDLTRDEIWEHYRPVFEKFGFAHH